MFRGGKKGLNPGPGVCDSERPLRVHWPEGRPLLEAVQTPSLFLFFAVAKMFVCELLFHCFPQSLNRSTHDVHFTIC